VWQAKAEATHEFAPAGLELDSVVRGRALIALVQAEAKQAHDHELAASAELEQVCGAEARGAVARGVRRGPAPPGDQVTGA